MSLGSEEDGETRGGCSRVHVSPHCTQAPALRLGKGHTGTTRPVSGWMRGAEAGTPDSAALDSPRGRVYYYTAGMAVDHRGPRNGRQQNGGMTAQQQGSDHQQGPKCK